MSGETYIESKGVNHLWAQILVEELLRLGVDTFCISPGGQSTPLVVAIDEHPKTKSIVHLDERGAAFYAVGLAKARKKPVALVCTSGTAVANYAPAVVEAYYAHEPLLLITADLPVELSDTGTNQAVEQSSMFSSFLRWNFDFADITKDFSWSHLLTAIDFAVHRAEGRPSGPVHLNCRFARVLFELESQKHQVPNSLANWFKGTDPFTNYPEGKNQYSEKDLLNLANRLEPSARGLILLGQLPTNAELSNIVALGKQLGWPILPSITSQLRSSGAVAEYPEGIFAHSVFYLGVPDLRESLFPEIVLHFGGDFVFHVQGEPICNSMHRFLRDAAPYYVHVQDSERRQDPLALVNERYVAEPNHFAQSLLSVMHSTASSEILGTFQRAEAIATQAIVKFERSGAGAFGELLAIRLLLSSLQNNQGLFLANSLPLREADLMLPLSSKQIFVGTHHGAKGIDGTIAAACGFAEGLALPTCLLLGDIAFLHDCNSLALVTNLSVPLLVVVINNNGGNIFQYVVAGKTEQFSEYFLTAHGMQFADLARQFALPYRLVTNISDLNEAVSEFLSGGVSCMLEISCPQLGQFAEHTELFSEIQGQLAETL